MKNEMYIILTLIPLLAGCGDKKEAARGTMPVPEISVASPVVKDITLNHGAIVKFSMPAEPRLPTQITSAT